MQQTKGINRDISRKDKNDRAHRYSVELYDQLETMVDPTMRDLVKKAYRGKPPKRRKL